MNKSKCGTCRGYGLWGMGESAPMGASDANDGMPTVPCPECGANYNPWSWDDDLEDEDDND